MPKGSAWGARQWWDMLEVLNSLENEAFQDVFSFFLCSVEKQIPNT